MVERSPIFGKDSTQIGYVEGGAAFDLCGRKRCNYSKETGNLFDDRRKTVGHVSLAGKFVGVSSLADKLFPKFDAAQMELRDVNRTLSQPPFEASQVAAGADLATAPSAADATGAIRHKGEKQPAADPEHRDSSETHGYPISEASQLATFTEVAEQSRGADPTEIIQLKDETRRRAADAESRGIGGAPIQPFSDTGQVVAHAHDAPSPLNSIEDIQAEDIQAKDTSEQHAADGDSSGTGSQLLSEPSQAVTPTELAEAPTTPSPTEVIQANDENEQRAADAERRDTRMLLQRLSEARLVTAPIESAEQPSTPDPIVQATDEEEQRAADVERSDFKTLIQQLSEGGPATALIDSAEQPTPAPTEVIRAQDENEQRVADAEHRDFRRLIQELSDARPVTALIKSAEQPPPLGPTEVIHVENGNEQRRSDAKRRDGSGTASQKLSEVSQAAATAELAEAPTTFGPTEAIQAENGNEQRRSDANRRDGSGTASQKLSEVSQVTATAELAEALTTFGPTEAIQAENGNEQRRSDAKRRDGGGMASQKLSEVSQVTATAELSEAPTTFGPTEAIQAENGNEQRRSDANRRDISRTLNRLVSEAMPVTAPIESAEQSTALDPTEAIQLNDEYEQRTANTEGRETNGTTSRSLSEASTVAAASEFAESPTRPGPTEAIRIIDEHERHAVDAEPRDISRMSSRPLSEARPVTAFIGSAAQPTAHDPTEVFLNDEHEQLAADRDGTKRPPLSEARQAANPAELVEVAITLVATEAIRAKDENEQGLADAERGVISRTPSQRLPTALTESAGQPTAPDPTEASRIKDENEQHAAHAQQRDGNGPRSRPLSPGSQFAAPAELADAPAAPGPSEAIYVQDANGHRTANAQSRGIGATPNQPISAPSEARTSAAGPVEALHSNDAEKARIAKLLNSLEGGAANRRRIGGTSSQPHAKASEVSTLAGPLQESSVPNRIETFKRAETAKDRFVKFVKGLKRPANAKRRGGSETPDKQLDVSTEVSMPTFSSPSATDSSLGPGTPDSSEALHARDADKNRLVEILKALSRSADANPDAVDGTPSLSPSAPTRVSTSPDAPAKLSASELAEGFPSSGTDKDRVVNVLKTLMERSRGLAAEAPRLQQAEETDLAITPSVVPDSPDKRKTQELESHGREDKLPVGSSGQDKRVGPEISTPIDNHVYQGSFAIQQPTEPHNAFGPNKPSAPLAATDPGSERQGRASANTSAAPAVRQLHDASPRTLTPAEDNAQVNARAGEQRRREGRMPLAVEAFVQRVGEFSGSHSIQATTLSSVGAATLKLGASADAFKDADPMPSPGAPDQQLESSDSARHSGPAAVASKPTENGITVGIESPVELVRDTDREGNSGAPEERARLDQARTFDDVDLNSAFSPEPETSWWFMRRRPGHR